MHCCPRSNVQLVKTSDNMRNGEFRNQLRVQSNVRPQRHYHAVIPAAISVYCNPRTGGGASLTTG
jgi:hypothetical protein